VTGALESLLPSFENCREALTSRGSRSLIFFIAPDLMKKGGSSFVQRWLSSRTLPAQYAVKQARQQLLQACCVHG
jgi:hypothetical protein